MNADLKCTRALNRGFPFAVFICLAFASTSSAQVGASAAGLAQLKSLRGEWEGTYQWTEARHATGPMNASYYVTGNGSALVENLLMDAHVHALKIRLIDSTHITLTFLFPSGSQESREQVALKRVDRKSAEKTKGSS